MGSEVGLGVVTSVASVVMVTAVAVDTMMVIHLSRCEGG